MQTPKRFFTVFILSIVLILVVITGLLAYYGKFSFLKSHARNLERDLCELGCDQNLNKCTRKNGPDGFSDCLTTHQNCLYMCSRIKPILDNSRMRKSR